MIRQQVSAFVNTDGQVSSATVPVRTGYGAELVVNFAPVAMEVLVICTLVDVIANLDGLAKIVIKNVLRVIMASRVSNNVQLAQLIMEMSGVTCLPVYVLAHQVKLDTFAIKNVLMEPMECDARRNVRHVTMEPNVIVSVGFANVYLDGWANNVELNVHLIIMVKNVNLSANAAMVGNVGHPMERVNVCLDTLDFIAKKAAHMDVTATTVNTLATVANMNSAILFLVAQQMLFTLHTASRPVNNHR